MSNHTIYEDGHHLIEVYDDNIVLFAIEHDSLLVSRWLCPHEAIAIGQALTAAGAEAGAQCACDGCMDPATEFGDDEPVAGVR